MLTLIFINHLSQKVLQYFAQIINFSPEYIWISLQNKFMTGFKSDFFFKEFSYHVPGWHIFHFPEKVQTKKWDIVCQWSVQYANKIHYLFTLVLRGS